MTVVLLLSTHADRQGVDISFTVCLFLCVTDFSSENKYSGVNVCTVVYRHPGQGISHFGNFAPAKPKIGRIGARRVDVGSACVDNRQSPSLAAIVVIISKHRM